MIAPASSLEYSTNRGNIQRGNTSATFHREILFPIMSDIKVDLCVHRSGDKCLSEGFLPPLSAASKVSVERRNVSSLKT